MSNIGKVRQWPLSHSTKVVASGAGLPFNRVEVRPLRKRSAPQGSLLSKLLLAVELIAAAALLYWLVTEFFEWRSLAKPLAGMDTQPVANGFSSMFPVGDELPGGHTAPRGGSVPEPLRHLFEKPVSLAIPTPAAGAPTRIVIPRISVDSVIVPGDGADELKMGVGHRLGTANPGQAGNMVLSGHNDIYGEVFRHLDQLAPGDEIIVYSGEVPFVYEVREVRVVSPTDISVLAPTSEPVVTIISCYPYLIDTHRIVVIGELRR